MNIPIFGRMDNLSQTELLKRKVNVEDIALPKGYKIDVFARGLTTPINITFSDDGDMLVGDAGITSGNGKIFRLTASGPQLIAKGFNPPLTGITFYKGDIYVSHRGFITKVKPDGKKENVLSGLPSFGDHHNNRVIFGPDGKMYFGQGTATNSGIVGEDNDWVEKYPFFHDYPGGFTPLNGHNFKSSNILSNSPDDNIWTGAYSPFGVPSYQGELIKGITRANGSILRANPDGSELELIAWGLRNPFRLRFDRQNRLFCGNHGIDVRGSRPIANSPDEFQWIRSGIWYGWPDYTGGMPVTDPFFRPEGKSQPTFLLTQHPMQPPKPITTFDPHSAIMGFDFNFDPDFAPVEEAYIAEFGSNAPTTTGGKPAPKVGHRISRINVNSGKVTTFAINKSGLAASATGGGGLERPIDVIFGKRKDMYIADFGITNPNSSYPFEPQSGIIWKITKL